MSPSSPLAHRDQYRRCAISRCSAEDQPLAHRLGHEVRPGGPPTRSELSYCNCAISPTHSVSRLGGVLTQSTGAREAPRCSGWPPNAVPKRVAGDLGRPALPPALGNKKSLFLQRELLVMGGSHVERAR